MFRDLVKLYLSNNKNISLRNSPGIFLSKHVLQLRLSLLIKTWAKALFTLEKGFPKSSFWPSENEILIISLSSSDIFSASLKLPFATLL